MELLLGGAIFSIIVVVIVASWMRGGYRNSGIEPWMLRVEGLSGLCSDYLDYIDEMNDPGHDYETLRYFHNQRHVTQDQILAALSLDRSRPLDMAAFARRYLRRDG